MKNAAVVKNVKIASILAAAILATACGGGGGKSGGSATTENNTQHPVKTTFVALGANGVLSNAQYCTDSDNDGHCTTGEIIARTNVSGQGETDGSGKVVLFTDRNTKVMLTNTSYALDKTIIMTAPAGSTIVSALTTLVDAHQEVISADINASKAAIAAQAGITNPMKNYVSAGNTTEKRVGAATFNALAYSTFATDVYGNDSAMLDSTYSAMNLLDSSSYGATDSTVLELIGSNQALENNADVSYFDDLIQNAGVTAVADIIDSACDAGSLAEVCLANACSDGSQTIHVISVADEDRKFVVTYENADCTGAASLDSTETNDIDDASHMDAQVDLYELLGSKKIWSI